MPKFLIEAAYTAEGLRGLQKDKASGRRDAVVKAVQGLEGKVEAFYFAMGKRDVVVIAELPDAVTAAAAAYKGPLRWQERSASATGQRRTPRSKGPGRR